MRSGVLWSASYLLVKGTWHSAHLPSCLANNSLSCSPVYEPSQPSRLARIRAVSARAFSGYFLRGPNFSRSLCRYPLSPFGIFWALLPAQQFRAFLGSECVAIRTIPIFLVIGLAGGAMALITSPAASQPLRHMAIIAKKVWLIEFIAACSGFPQSMIRLTTYTTHMNGSIPFVGQKRSAPCRVAAAFRIYIMPLRKEKPPLF